MERNECFLFGFEKLVVWNESRALTTQIYKLTKDFPDYEKYGLVSQIRRSAISVCSNIAEGSARVSGKDQAHFYQLAYSSLMELLNQIIISVVGLLYEQNLIDHRKQTEKIANKLNALRKSRLKQQTNKQINE